MGKTLGVDREMARRIKRMSRKELDGYLTRVTDRTYENGYEEGYENGYEEGLVDGMALSGQGLEVVLKKCVEDNLLTQQLAKRITKAVDEHVATTLGREGRFREVAQGAGMQGTSEAEGGLEYGA